VTLPAASRCGFRTSSIELAGAVLVRVCAGAAEVNVATTNAAAAKARRGMIGSAGTAGGNGPQAVEKTEQKRVLRAFPGCRTRGSKAGDETPVTEAPFLGNGIERSTDTARQRQLRALLLVSLA